MTKNQYKFGMWRWYSFNMYQNQYVLILQDFRVSLFRYMSQLSTSTLIYPGVWYIQLGNFLKEVLAKVVINWHHYELCIRSHVSYSDSKAGVNIDEVQLSTIYSAMHVCKHLFLPSYSATILRHSELIRFGHMF